MSLAIGIYLLLGAILGWAWTRGELGRTGPRRWGPSVGLCLVAWPLLIVLAIALVAVSARLDTRRHRTAPRVSPAPSPAPEPGTAPLSLMAGAPEPGHPA